MRNLLLFIKMDTEDEYPTLHSIVKAEVASLQSYGAFMKIDGFRKQGLVHISQISNSKVENPSDVLEKGESVWCKVVSVSDGKLGLSMKLVSQSTGKDLDPTNVEATEDAKRRKPRHSDRAPIALEAVLDTQCRKCGGKGHLAQDCFHTPGGRTYELVEEETRPVFAGPNQLLEHHQKKKKKDKKKKHRRESNHSSDSESEKKSKHRKRKSESRHDDGESSARKRKKVKGKKKKKRKSSSSDSSD